jgi:GT2 family glycosyltransferase
VVVVNWNRRELLAACLRSLAAQTHPDFDVYVVDNGSEDGSAEAVAKITKTFPVGLQLIQNTTNRGFCAANNQGIAASTGRFIALLNNDAEAEPGWLEALEAVIESDPAVGMAA